MAITNIIQGGLPTATAIAYWETANVSLVKNPDQSIAYAIAPGGYMRQRVTLNVTGTTHYNVVYRYPDAIEDAHMILMLNHSGDKKSVALIFMPGTGDTTSYGSLSGTFDPDTGAPVGQMFGIENNSNQTLYINILEWYFDSTADSDGISATDFMQKAFLYGLDADKPELGTGGDE